MSEKKRKAAEAVAEPPPKKALLEKRSKTLLKVKYVQGPNVAKPVIASGVRLSRDLEFQSFSKALPNASSELLLYSTSHPTIDFKAKEGATSTDKYLKHYVAVFDPASKSLDVIEAKKLTFRSSLRQRDPEPDSDEDEKAKATTTYASRAALTQTFGTKKSKKAVQSMAENKLLARGGNDANNPLSNAILSTMPSPEPLDDVPASPRANKPLPIANLSTAEISEVYSISTLVFPEPASSTLSSMPIARWLDSITKKKEIETTSRFVSHRAVYLAASHLADPSNTHVLQLVQLHRYIQLLVELHRHIRTVSQFKRIPPPSSWPKGTITGNFDHEFLVSLVKAFSPTQNGLSKNQITFLQSTILAMTLHIPPPSMNAGQNVLITELTDVQLDLAMKPEDVRKLYRELGCKLEFPKPAELDRWGLRKPKPMKPKNEERGSLSALTVTQKPKFAILKFPIEFPKVSVGRTAPKGARR